MGRLLGRFYRRLKRTRRYLETCWCPLTRPTKEAMKKMTKSAVEGSKSKITMGVVA
jgi:hypothetical protein